MDITTIRGRHESGTVDAPSARGALRPSVRGKFLFLDEAKHHVRGVTYGPFRPSSDGPHYPEQPMVERDFARIAASGFNAVRTYDVPPLWLLDAARRHGLRVMVGVAWEQHVAFLDDSRLARSIERKVREDVAVCATMTDAVLCYAVGNEIPPPIVRWHGHRKIERFLRRLSDVAREADPESLVTYVNYPSTEYLDLSFLDFQCFNVYLESQPQLESYIARLQNIAGDQPLMLAEIGLDSLRNGELAQAQSIAWQVRTGLEGGCAGAFVFAWTDEWHRGGYDIENWDFGLTDRARRPKPALAAATAAFAHVPERWSGDWPRVSVVVCSHNGERTIGDTLGGLTKLTYPDYEVIVVDDGSSDGTASVAATFGARVISTENRGLASARNTGRHASSGEIVAYVDDDARPDPDWLFYLAATFRGSGYAGVGGPNIPPPDEEFVAACVAHAPGGPVHVLLSDREAEHIPGCNMAFRKECLEAVGGFDPSFAAAGDDVDICWALQRAGWALGFNPGAVVWHRRRNSIGGYLRQQRGYGRAEALLERKWPEKYNVAGHLTWGGRVYSKAGTQPFGRRWRIYYGTWGSGLFQQRIRRGTSTLGSALITPEFYLLLALLSVMSALGVIWEPLFMLLAPVALLALALVVQASASAHSSVTGGRARGRWKRLKLGAVTTALNLLQPGARLWGRLSYGLTPWRRRANTRLAIPRPRQLSIWSEVWNSPQARLHALETALRRRVTVLRGGDCDRWDLEVFGGMLGRTRLQMTNEEHGSGHQLLRFRLWPRSATVGVAVLVLLIGLATGAAVLGAWAGAGVFGGAAILVAARLLRDCAAATGVALSVIETWSAHTGDVIVDRAPRLWRRRRPLRGQASTVHSELGASSNGGPTAATPSSSIEPAVDLEQDLYASLAGHSTSQSAGETPETS